ncbi:MAG TPA: hypothetical protein VEB63_00305 [Chitinophagaceae bacterium]|nr:hypothetical protein [Chitinophagaceae bacterium]
MFHRIPNFVFVEPLNGRNSTYSFSSHADLTIRSLELIFHI